MAMSASMPIANASATDRVTGVSATSTACVFYDSRVWVPRASLLEGAGVSAAAALGVRDRMLGVVASFTPRATRIAPVVRYRWVLRCDIDSPDVLYRCPAPRSLRPTLLRRMDLSSTSERRAPSSLLITTGSFRRAFSVSHESCLAVRSTLRLSLSTSS